MGLEEDAGIPGAGEDTVPLPTLPALTHWDTVNQLLHTQTDIKTPATWRPAGPPFLVDSG